MFNLGILAIRVDYTTLANFLLYRTTEVGEEQAVEELGRYNRLESTPALGILAISGIEVESKIDLWGGISLIPASFIPDCLLKDSFNDVELALKHLKAAMPMAPDFNNSNPKSALVKKWKLNQKVTRMMKKRNLNSTDKIYTRYATY
jgi:hypothetical protein